MEWIYGIPLSRLLKRELTAAIRNKIATDLISALKQLHENNITHGDLKPENVIVTPNRGIVFVDFGFSFILRNNKSYTNIQGTPSYMAPELWVAPEQKIDYRKADLFALGILLEQILEQPMPDFVKSLQKIDPAQRISNCKLVEKEWQFVNSCHCDDSSQSDIADAVAMYIAELLLKNSRLLYLSGNTDEAYTLLIESLEKWPDNSEALTFLTECFSVPTKRKGIKIVLRYSCITILTVCALLSSYFYGRNRSENPLLNKTQNVFELTKLRRLQILVPKTEVCIPAEISGALRSTNNRTSLAGKLIVSLPKTNGTLYINGKEYQMIPSVKNFSGWFSSGDLRIEWYDSTTQHKYGETTNLLPFAAKKISLKRFEQGYTYGK